jgi:hypothetical protein
VPQDALTRFILSISVTISVQSQRVGCLTTWCLAIYFHDMDTK